MTIALVKEQSLSRFLEHYHRWRRRTFPASKNDVQSKHEFLLARLDQLERRLSNEGANTNYSDGLELTNDWFQQNISAWDQIIPTLEPRTILEIGSYEGASTCYMISTCARVSELEIHAVDTWEGSDEHKHSGIDLGEVERRFKNNTTLLRERSKFPVELFIHKKTSHLALANLLSEGKASYFDLIYVDGSHEAPDVFADAALSFILLKPRGIIIFDDYLWAYDSLYSQEATSYGKDLLRCPKLAIDSFCNVYAKKLQIIPNTPNQQVFARKISE